jgi:hypothetical protein
LFDRLYFEILLSKSTVGHHAKGRAMKPSLDKLKNVLDIYEVTNVLKKYGFNQHSENIPRQEMQ